MINEETLTLYYYEDGLTADERRNVETAMQKNTLLAAQYADLCAQFDSWREPDEHQLPAHLIPRWRDSIVDAAKSEALNSERSRRRKRSSGSSFWSIAWGGAIAVALAVGIGIGVYFSANTALLNPTDIPLARLVDTPAMAVPASFTRGLQMHLQDSEREITRLTIGAPADQAELIMQIIEQNRIFERSAKLNNSDNLARVLRAFEPILMRLASDDIAPADAAALRAQLSFELKVMLTKMAQRPSNETHST